MLWLGFIFGIFSCTLQERCELIFTSTFRCLGFDRSSLRSMLMNFHSSVFFDIFDGVSVFIYLVDTFLSSPSLPSVLMMFEEVFLSLSLNLRLNFFFSCELLLEQSMEAISCCLWQSLRSTTFSFFSLLYSSQSLLWLLRLLRWLFSFLLEKTQPFSLDLRQRWSMASRIYFYFLVRATAGCLMATLGLQDCLEELALEELDLLELLRGRSFYFFALVLKKLNVLSIDTIVKRYCNYIGNICEKIIHQNHQNYRITDTRFPSNATPSSWYSHSISTFFRSSSLLMSTFSALHPRSSPCFPTSSLNSSYECDPRHTSPCSRQCLSFSFWQTPRKPQSMGLSSLGRACRATAMVFSSSCRLQSLSAQKWSSTRVRRRLSYMSQKQGKQELLDSCPFRVFLKKLQSSSLRFSLQEKATWGDSTSFTISMGMASSIFLSSGSSSSSNSTGRHSLTQKEALPQTSSNWACLAIFSHLLKSVHLLLRNFSSKTNLQATNISQATRMLRKEDSTLKISPFSLMNWSSFRISFLIRFSSPSYFVFLTFSCPNRQRQNSSSSGNKFFRRSYSFSFIFAHRKMSFPQRLTSLFSFSFQASDESVRLFSRIPSLQKLTKLSLTIQLMISYSSYSYPCGVLSRKGFDSASVISSRQQFNFENFIKVTIFLAFISAIWQWKDTSWRGGAALSSLTSVSVRGISLILIIQFNY